MKNENFILLQKGCKIQNIRYIVRTIAEIFNTPTTLLDERIDISIFRDTHRAQYNAAKIIDAQEKRPPGKYLIITLNDLFIPIFTFVFGLAKLSGNIAVISSHRLTNRYYGIPLDEALFTERIIKESVHEIGHLYGLRHCLQYNCVMVNSTAVEEIDVKNRTFCPACAALINREREG